MKNVFALLFVSLLGNISFASQIGLTADDSKIKSCLSSLYASQVKFKKQNGYFAARPEELQLTRYKPCDGLEISTHMVTDSRFRMTAKFNHKVWSVDESKKLQPQQKD